MNRISLSNEFGPKVFLSLVKRRVTNRKLFVVIGVVILKSLGDSLNLLFCFLETNRHPYQSTGMKFALDTALELF